VYYREVKSLRLKENSQNTTMTFLFGAVLTENWGRFNRKWGRFGLGLFSTGAVLTGNHASLLTNPTKWQPFNKAEGWKRNSRM